MPSEWRTCACVEYKIIFFLFPPVPSSPAVESRASMVIDEPPQTRDGTNPSSPVWLNSWNNPFLVFQTDPIKLYSLAIQVPCLNFASDDCCIWLCRLEQPVVEEEDFLEHFLPYRGSGQYMVDLFLLGLEMHRRFLITSERFLPDDSCPAPVHYRYFVFYFNYIKRFKGKIEFTSMQALRVLLAVRDSATMPLQSYIGAYIYALYDVLVYRCISGPLRYLHKIDGPSTDGTKVGKSNESNWVQPAK